MGTILAIVTLLLGQHIGSSVCNQSTDLLGSQLFSLLISFLCTVNVMVLYSTIFDRYPNVSLDRKTFFHHLPTPISASVTSTHCSIHQNHNAPYWMFFLSLKIRSEISYGCAVHTGLRWFCPVHADSYLKVIFLQYLHCSKQLMSQWQCTAGKKKRKSRCDNS